MATTTTRTNNDVDGKDNTNTNTNDDDEAGKGGWIVEKHSGKNNNESKNCGGEVGVHKFLLHYVFLLIRNKVLHFVA